MSRCERSRHVRPHGTTPGCSQSPPHLPPPCRFPSSPSFVFVVCASIVRAVAAVATTTMGQWSGTCLFYPLSVASATSMCPPGPARGTSTQQHGRGGRSSHMHRLFFESGSSARAAGVVVWGMHGGAYFCDFVRLSLAPCLSDYVLAPSTIESLFLALRLGHLRPSRPLLRVQGLLFWSELSRKTLGSL